MLVIPYLVEIPMAKFPYLPGSNFTFQFKPRIILVKIGLAFPIRAAFLITITGHVTERCVLYFSDYKMHFSPPDLEGKWGASHSPNVAYLTHWGEVGGSNGVGFFSLFSSSKT